MSLRGQKRRGWKKNRSLISNEIHFSQNAFKKTSTIGREVKNYGQSKKCERKFYADKRKGDSNDRANHGYENADSAAADFSFAYFWILNVRRKNYISSHPIQC